MAARVGYTAMPHGYTKDGDSSDLLKYSKRHKNGDRTDIEVNGKIPGEEWEVNVTDPNGNKSLGRFGTKAEARKRATSWMRKHPKGVPGSKKDVSGFGGGIPGTDGDSLF